MKHILEQRECRKTNTKSSAVTCAAASPRSVAKLSSLLEFLSPKPPNFSLSVTSCFTLLAQLLNFSVRRIVILLSTTLPHTSEAKSIYIYMILKGGLIYVHNDFHMYYIHTKIYLGMYQVLIVVLAITLTQML